MVPDGELSNNADIFQIAAQACTLSPNFFKVHTNDTLVLIGIEGAKQGVTVREDTVTGLMFANDFVGILLTSVDQRPTG